jgi:putative ABC transport system substrate-binding protein
VASSARHSPPRRRRQGRVWRIGYLSADDPSAASHLVEAFRQGLRDLGYVEGRNVIIEFRVADGKYDRLPHLAAELVRYQVDVIMAFTIPAVRAAKNATTAIPIVFAQVLDPVGAGLVAKLARPGANVTGVSIMVEELSGKYLELLKEVVPRMSQVAVLWEPDQPAGALLLTHIERAARALRVQLQPLKVQNPNDFDNAFSSITRLRADAFLVLPSSLFNLYRYRRLPTSRQGAGCRRFSSEENLSMLAGSCPMLRTLPTSPDAPPLMWTGF